MRLFDRNQDEIEARRRTLEAIGDARLSGFQVARALDAGRDESSVYPALHRLEADGRLLAAWTPNDSGVTRRTYCRRAR